MSEQEKTPETFEQMMTRLQEQVDNIDGSLATLLTCKEAGNLKQVSYWVGQVSRQVSNLCRECMGEELLKAVAEREKGRIVTR